MCVEQALVAYQSSLKVMVKEDVLDRYYLRATTTRRLPLTPYVSEGLQEIIQKTISRARRRTSARVFKHITEIGPDGTRRLRGEAHPKLQHLHDEIKTPLVDAVHEYRAAVPADVDLLLSHYRITDIVLRVVGVGSVGTRCYLVILVGPRGKPLILQIKEATGSVLDEYGRWGSTGKPQHGRGGEREGQGARVVDGQRILQAMSDVFLGGRHASAGATFTCGSTGTG